MTDLSILEQDEARSEKTIARAMTAFDTTLDTLQEAVETLKADYKNGAKDVIDQVRSMNKAFQSAMEAEAQARGSLRKQGIYIGSGSLDLDGARDEVRLRLACLRDAKDD